MPTNVQPLAARRKAQPMNKMLHLMFGIGLCVLMLASAAYPRSKETDARAAIQVFADNCFSPFMTADKAAKSLQLANNRYDFYDLDPFSSAAPSPAMGRAATPGTDRRCEVSFDGAHTEPAIQAVADALQREGILTEASVPAQFQPTDGTALLAARRLNPRKIAVVHVGTRPGLNGIETFMNVERLRLSDDQS